MLSDRARASPSVIRSLFGKKTGGSSSTSNKTPPTPKASLPSENSTNGVIATVLVMIAVLSAFGLFLGLSYAYFSRTLEGSPSKPNVSAGGEAGRERFSCLDEGVDAADAYTAYPTKCFDCERQFVEMSSPEEAWRGQPTKCFDCEKRTASPQRQHPSKCFDCAKATTKDA